MSACEGRHGRRPSAASPRHFIHALPYGSRVARDPGSSPSIEGHSRGDRCARCRGHRPCARWLPGARAICERAIGSGHPSACDVRIRCARSLDPAHRIQHPAACPIAGAHRVEHPVACDSGAGIRIARDRGSQPVFSATGHCATERGPAGTPPSDVELAVLRSSGGRCPRHEDRGEPGRHRLERRVLCCGAASRERVVSRCRRMGVHEWS